MIKDCYKLLKEMEYRPQLYVGECSLKAINLFIAGYNFCLSEFKLIKPNNEMDPFFDWVANKLGYYESTAGWVNMINRYTMGYSSESKSNSWEEFLEIKMTDEQNLKAVKYFYELLEVYIKED